MTKLREVLLTQYIGAITIGFVLAQTVTGVISGLVQTGFNYYWTSHDSNSVLGGTVPFPWKTLLFWLVTAVPGGPRCIYSYPMALHSGRGQRR